MHEFQSEVFMIIGGCTKEERFVAEVTCLDPLRRSRLEVAKLPLTEHELESENKKWVEFACVTLKNEVYISGKREAGIKAVPPIASYTSLNGNQPTALQECLSSPWSSSVGQDMGPGA